MKVVVAGQGYVGLPLAVRAAEAGHRVVGYDVDPDRVQRLAAAESYVKDVASSRLRAVLDSGAYCPTADAAALAGFDIAVITVPTSLRTASPNVLRLLAAVRGEGHHLLAGGGCEAVADLVEPNQLLHPGGGWWRGAAERYPAMSSAAAREASMRIRWAAGSACRRAIRISMPMSGDTARSSPPPRNLPYMCPGSHFTA